MIDKRLGENVKEILSPDAFIFNLTCMHTDINYTAYVYVLSPKVSFFL